MTGYVDIGLEWRGDLEIGSDGDLRIVSLGHLTRQRAIRRLMTVDGDYIWAIGYGAGLPQLIGKPYDIRAVEAKVRTQLKREASISSSVPPKVWSTDERAPGSTIQVLNIAYTEANSETERELTVNLVS